MNRIVILRLIFLGRLLSRRPSSIRRAGFYAADMSVEIILDLIRPLARQSPVARQAEVRKSVIARGGCGYSIIRRVDPGTLPRAGCANWQFDQAEGCCLTNAPLS
jgi:hypothetical protein